MRVSECLDRGDHMIMLIFHYPEFTKFMIGDIRPKTCKTVLLVEFRDLPMIKTMTFNKRDCNK